MHFFLQIDADGAISANHLVGANAGCSRHISAGISQTNVGWVIANGMLGAFKGCSSKLAKEKLPRCFSPWLWTKLRRKNSRSSKDE